MPELPDLQVFSKNLHKQLAGKKVTKFLLHGKKAKSSPEKFRQHIEKQAVSRIFREGKQLYIEFANGTVLGMHLMLHGDLHVVEDKENLNHSILEMIFDDGRKLVLTDWQGAAVPSLNPPPNEVPDALSNQVNADYLREKLQSRGVIKNILLDQKVIRGIGNAYADEILWEAGISPFSIANKIPDKKITQLAKAIKDVLKDAEKQIVKKHPNIISGEVRDFLKIHNSKKKNSPDGAAIMTEVRGGRKTYYTEEQEVYK